jgi:hypothetical protein
MIRHLDSGHELIGNKKRLYGMMIVEADNEGDVPIKWVEYSSQIRSNEVLHGSLPHRDEGVRKTIRDSFVGITTWQKICAELNIPRQVLINSVKDL